MSTHRNQSGGRDDVRRVNNRVLNVGVSFYPEQPGQMSTSLILWANHSPPRTQDGSQMERKVGRFDEDLQMSWTLEYKVSSDEIVK